MHPFSDHVPTCTPLFGCPAVVTFLKGGGKAKVGSGQEETRHFQRGVPFQSLVVHSCFICMGINRTPHAY